MSTPAPAFCGPFPVADDCLQVAGMPLTRLAERVGRTPFYAYDRSLIKERVALLRRHLPGEVALYYALKANPMPALVAYLAGLVDGLDVASAGELRVALDSGTAAARISFAGPGKTEAELRQAVAAGILLNVESFREARVLARISEELGSPARVAVRVNPDFELGSSAAQMGGGPRPFGVDAEQVPQLLREIGALGLRFEGFHFFAGSQSLCAEAIVEAQVRSYALAVRLSREAPAPVQVVNIGGGFGIPYFPGERALDLAPIGCNLGELVERLRRDLPGARLVLELGRYLVGEAGIYVCRVIDRKASRGHVFLVTDGGLHHHLFACGGFGPVSRKNYPVVVGNRVQGERRETVSVVGPLCTPQDRLADRVELAEAHPGDLIVVFQSGAYGLTASPTAFLSHPLPAEILV